MTLDGDGAEIDWTVGYSPPPDKFQEKIGLMIAGVGTFKTLSSAYAQNPKDIETVFKLAQKWSDRSDTKASEKYKEILALDPDGKMGTTEFRNEKVTYTQYAEFNMGSNALRARPPDPALLLAFIKKYPDSAMVKDAYNRMTSYYGRTAPKADAAKFFEEYATRFPQDPMALGSWVRRIIQDKEPLDKGLELALKAVDLSQGFAKASAQQSLAQVYILKGDKAKAAETAELIVKSVSDASATPAMLAMPMAGAGEPPPASAAPMFLMSAARIFVEADKTDRALAVFGPDYLKKNMDNARALAGYASFWSSQDKNLESALEAAKKAAELTPDAYASWNTLSQIYLKMKNYDEAIKATQKAVDIAPTEQLKERLRKQIEQIKTEKEKK